MAQNQYGQFGFQPGNMDNEPLPQGWEKMVDKATGCPFFVDHNTKQTFWHDPRMNKMQTGSPGLQNQSRVREIPVFHENSGRNTPPRMYSDSPGFRTPPRTDSPSQQHRFGEGPVHIPIHHEGSRGSPQPQRVGTPPMQREMPQRQSSFPTGGIPIHVRQEGWGQHPSRLSGSPNRSGSPSGQPWHAFPQHSFPEPLWTRDVPIVHDRFGPTTTFIPPRTEARNTPPPQPQYQAPPTQPQYQAPPTQPQYQAPPTQPQYQAPTQQPQYQAPTQQPQYQAPPQQPQYQAPTQQPQYQAPPQQPQYQAPPTQPQYQAPPTQPQYQAPPQQPQYQAPTQQPQYQAPPQQPHYQASPQQEPPTPQFPQYHQAQQSPQYQSQQEPQMDSQHPPEPAAQYPQEPQHHPQMEPPVIAEPQDEPRREPEPKPEERPKPQQEDTRQHPPVHATINQLQAEERPAHGRSPSPAPPNVGPLEHIGLITEEAEKLRLSVESFSGTKKDKGYLYLEEMLTRLLIKLDRIESEGKDEIRQARKQGVRVVQGCLDQLELKSFANEAPMPTGTQNQSGSHSDYNSKTEQNNYAGNNGQKSQQGNRSNETNGERGAHVSEMVLDSEVAC